jgi:glyoxylase-like metal-dependent hydrolase (beta-lactamase superfamily II)
MKFKNKIFFLSLFLVLSVYLLGGTINGLPLHIKELSDNAIRLWVGDFISSTAVSALNTDKGIVVIDTTQCPSLDVQFRKIIAKKFGNKKFIYLINTHEHGDHTSGNSVYSDCEIIAHEKCAKGMQRIQADQQRAIDWYKEYIPKLEKQLSEAKEGTETYKKIKEDVIVRKMNLEAFESGIKLKLPTKTFKDKLKLNMGNMTIELFYMGGLHSSSDIFVLVPEEGLLFTGDVMADVWLTDTPGCLQSFGGRSGIERNLPLMMENWKSLINRKDEIKDYIPGHWNGDLTYNGFVARYNYMETLQKEVKKAVEENKELKVLLTDLQLKTRFPKLAGTPGFTRDFVHNNNITTLWIEISGAESASNALAEMIEKKGLKTAIDKFRDEYKNGSKSKKYYFLEQEFNSLGYRFLNHKKYPEAIEIFKLNVEMYPESKNVYDSLGEAYLNAGQKKLALSYYNKVLKMDPKDSNAKKMIGIINQKK